MLGFGWYLCDMISSYKAKRLDSRCFSKARALIVLRLFSRALKYA
jgi:hypothetical protein